MTPEGDPTKFRRGENARKPIGGNVADSPFAQSLHTLAVSRGFESQLGLAKALGKKSNRTVSSWYRGENFPTPEEFGNLLILLEPSNEELEPLAAEYGVRLVEGKIKPLLTRHVNMVPSSDSLGRWIEDTAKKRKITFEELSRRLGIAIKFSRSDLSLGAISKILESASQEFGLTPEETEELANAAARSIEQRIQKGKRFSHAPINPGELRAVQKGLSCRTYNGKQAGQILGLSRERVRQLRKRYGLPMLLTDEHLKILAGRRKPLGHTPKSYGPKPIDASNSEGKETDRLVNKA